MQPMLIFNDHEIMLFLLVFRNDSIEDLFKVLLPTDARRPQDLRPRHRVIDQQKDPETVDQVGELLRTGNVIVDVKLVFARFVVVNFTVVVKVRSKDERYARRLLHLQHRRHRRCRRCCHHSRRRRCRCLCRHRRCRSCRRRRSRRCPE